jgi:electron transport complex protein RnfB
MTARTVAQIREDECIGCTKCILACPHDAIVGAAKQMHIVLDDLCTGCDACVAPCPVDCIDLAVKDHLSEVKPSLRHALKVASQPNTPQEIKPTDNSVAHQLPNTPIQQSQATQIKIKEKMLKDMKKAFERMQRAKKNPEQQDQVIAQIKQLEAELATLLAL